MSYLSGITLANPKDKLKPVPFTTLTMRDGSRFSEARDGTLTELPSEFVDQNGQWGVMDENAALRLDSNDGSLKSLSKPPCFEPSAKLLALVSLHSELSPFLRLVKVGAPFGNVQMRLGIEMERGCLERAVASKFMALALADGLGSESSFAPSSSSPRGAAPEVVGSALVCDHFSEVHGHLGDPRWAFPRLAVACEAEARPGYASAKGHEYLDTPVVVRAKVKLLAALLRSAKHAAVYAGAGLSTSSGIGDYATKTGLASVVRQGGSGGSSSSSSNTGGALGPMCAAPSLGHRVLASLAREGLLGRFVQQNHDGLPQKAGLPQHLVNEIHGGWFDPSNPVVAMSGSLRGDLFEDLLAWEAKADLVLALGTSLCGMNADRLVSAAARRAQKDRERKAAAAAKAPTAAAATTTTSVLKRFLQTTGRRPYTPEEGVGEAEAGGARIEEERGEVPVGNDIEARLAGLTAYGSVIVSLQRTVHDQDASLRIFGLIDDVMALLAQELGLPTDSMLEDEEKEQEENVTVGKERREGGDDVFTVPYDAQGERVLSAAGASCVAATTTWDLREGSRLVVASGPDQGAKATVVSKNRDGHYRICIERKSKKGGWSFKETRLLGAWWPAAAVEGKLARIPLVADSSK